MRYKTTIRKRADSVNRIFHSVSLALFCISLVAVLIGDQPRIFAGLSAQSVSAVGVLVAPVWIAFAIFYAVKDGRKYPSSNQADVYRTMPKPMQILTIIGYGLGWIWLCTFIYGGYFIS